MKITFGSLIKSTFNWNGSIMLTASGKLAFYSKEKQDIKLAHILEEKFSEDFTSFQFYSENSGDKVLFDANCILDIK